MVLGFLSEADYKLVAKAIRYRVTAVKHQRRLKNGQPDHAPKTAERPSPTPDSSTRASAAETAARQVSQTVPMETGEGHDGSIGQSNGSILVLVLA